MVEGTPGEWMRNWITTRRRQRLIGYGTWADFQQALDDHFLDRNIERNEYNNLDKLAWDWSKETLNEFFQKFEILAGLAGYMNNDQELIKFLEKKMPSSLTLQLYSGGRFPPNRYVAYRNELLDINTAQNSFRAMRRTATISTETPSSSKKTSSRKKTPAKGTSPPPAKPRFFFKKATNAAQQQVPDSSRKPEGNCYRCGKPGHFKADCKDPHGRVGQMRSLLGTFTEDELNNLNTALDQDFPQDFPEDL
jgi:hypothetical protein